MGAVAKSYMRRPLDICILLCNRSLLAFLIYEENFVFFFLSVVEIIFKFFVVKYFQVNEANLQSFVRHYFVKVF
jgi:hypothetical protein